MNRPLAGFLIGAAVLSLVATAPDAAADVGRYQLVPNVLVPNKAGKMEAQAVLLDTSTGRTWRLGEGAQKGQAKGPRWVPLDITFADRVSSSAAATKPAQRKTPDTEPTHKSRKNRLGEDYDNDP